MSELESGYEADSPVPAPNPRGFFGWKQRGWAGPSAARLATMLTGIVGLMIVAGFRQPIGAAQVDDATKPESANMQALTAIDKAINLGGKAECEQAAIKLRELGTRDLTQTERETWLRFSRDTAIRNADLKTLQALKEIPDSFSLDSIYTVLLAYGKLAKADVAGATAQLDCLHDLHNITPTSWTTTLQAYIKNYQIFHCPDDLSQNWITPLANPNSQ